MESPGLKLSILIPVRNEDVNAGIMLKILKAVINVPHEVLIVYDSPEDSTVPAVKKIESEYGNIRLIHNRSGRGIPNAIKAGVSGSRGKYILLFAIDEVGPVLAIEDMFALMDEGCDLVSCTRYAYGGRRLGGSPIGGILSRAGNELFRLLSGATFTDGTTGIKMFRKEFFDKLVIESNPAGWAVVFEIAIKAQKAGLKIGEVPITSIDRLYGGKSTFSLRSWFKEYLRWFMYGVKELRKVKNKEKTLVRIPRNLV